MKKPDEMHDVAAFVLSEAMALGATDVEVWVRSELKGGFTVRMGNPENALGSETSGVSFKVYVGNRQASILPTPEFRRPALRSLIKNRISAAQMSTEDPFEGLPEPGQLARTPLPDLDLWCEDLAAMPNDRKIALALATEKAALDSDPRIVNSEGAQFQAHSGTVVYANSRGFANERTCNLCALAVSIVACGVDGKKQSGAESACARKLCRLRDPHSVGRVAAHEALRMLGARRVPSCRVPVIYDRRVAASLLGVIASAASGMAIYQKQSFLRDKLDQMVASPSVTIHDDPFIRGGMGSHAYGPGGLAVKARNIIEEGRLAAYFLDAPNARRLQMEPNGGPQSNLYLVAGDTTLGDMIKSVKKGLYVTGLAGDGVNLGNGDYSLGATGLWIENGELVYPVDEITIASDLLTMFGSIDAVGSDLVFEDAVNSPSLLIGEMQVAGT